MKKRDLVLLGMCLMPLAHAETINGDMLVLLDGTEKSFEQWQEKSFEGETSYGLASEDSESFVKAVSNGTASGMFLKKEINLDEYPVIEWTWRVDQSIAPHDEKVKDGDDYAARLYVVVDGGFFFWKTIALNYVWSSNTSSAEPWPNAFAGENAQMLAVRGNEHRTNQWFSERRNLKEDFKRYFGEDVSRIDAIAIMTDTDNYLQPASASYGKIRMLKE